MVFKARRDPERIDHRETLSGVPALSERVTLEERADKNITLKVQTPRGGNFFDRFRPALMEKKYELDELGTFVVQLINGQHTILSLVNEFEEQYKVNRREAELSVVSFMKMLLQRRAITMLAGEDIPVPAKNTKHKASKA